MQTRNRLLLEPGSMLADKGGAPAGDPPVKTWVDELPPELKTAPSIGKFKTVTDLAKGYINAESLIGTKRIPEPQADWKDDQWADFYTKVGRPLTPDGYVLPKDLPLPEGMTLDAEKMKKTNAALHAAGLTPKQHEAVMRYYTGTLAEAYKTQQDAQKAAEATGTATLKQEWGDKFEANLDVARSVIKKFGDDGLLTALESTGAANDPAVIRALHKIGAAMLDDHAHGAGDGGLKVLDSTSALREIESLKLDPEFQKALSSREHTGHRAAVDRWTKLHETAYKEKQQEV